MLKVLFLQRQDHAITGYLASVGPRQLGAPKEDNANREVTMNRKSPVILTTLVGALLTGTSLATAADVTPQRLLNPEPNNWLMNHRTYDGQRYSPLDKINKSNVKALRLAYAVALGGSAGNEFIQATPLAEDGFLYITDSWGVLYKIDVCLSGWLPIRCVGDNGRGWTPEAFRRLFQSFSGFSRMTQPARDIWSICAGQTVSPVRNA